MTLPVVVMLAVAAAACLWAVLTRGRRQRRMQEMSKALQAHLRQAGQRVIIPPQEATFRGAHFRFGRKVARGLICASRRRVVFRKLNGQGMSIDREDIAGLSQRHFFLGRFRWGRLTLVLEMADRNEIGFFVADPDAWADILSARPAAGATSPREAEASSLGWHW